MGDLEFRRGRVLEATTLYEEAHTRAARAGEQQLLAASLLRSALAYRELDRLDDAGNAVRRALEIAQDTGARWIEAEALLASADLDRRRMRLEPALALYAEAESLLQPDLDPELLWQVHFGRAMALEAQGNLDAAIDALASAVAVIEGVRNQLAEPRFRAGYVEDKYEVYVELVRLQLQKGKKSDAFSTAERLRARSYAEQLRGRSTLPLSDEDRKTESQLRERIRQLQRVIAAEELGLDGAIRRPALARFSAELLLAEREYQAFLDDQRASRPVDSASDLFPTSAAVQARLRPHEALLEFVVGRASLVIFVMTERDLHATSVSVGRAQLEARVGLIRDLVQRPGNKQWKKPARSLAALLLDPIRSDDWLAGVQHLYIVPHGALNYLPFAALIETVGDVDRALVEQFTLTQLPAAYALLNGRGTTGGEAVLAVAPSRSRLRYAPDEARSVDELFQPNSRLLLGASATESEFKNVAAEYGVLHIATHGYFNKLNPLLSGLELEPDASNDGLLEVFEVLGLRLRADLVTLSACDTALGSGYFSDVPPGDEIVGMTRAF
ncbi:MAG TPA: CHAT domain-containing tetratricopeptide repeat protein, partial [Steroidobacteraceae bacterium]|nr:CHAT domain-containing tetratricopeptide repeat protein [Steroidobacteraceae bacterium]